LRIVTRESRFVAFFADSSREIAREAAFGFRGFRRRIFTHRVPGATYSPDFRK